MWRTITHSNDPKRYVKGTELEYRIPPGFNSRFAVYSVRTVSRDAAGYSLFDVRFVVRDAATVSDAEVREGKRPAIVFSAETEREINNWLDAQR